VRTRPTEPRRESLAHLYRVVDLEGYLTIVDRKQDMITAAFTLSRYVELVPKPPKAGPGKH